MKEETQKFTLKPGAIKYHDLVELDRRFRNLPLYPYKVTHYYLTWGRLSIRITWRAMYPEKE